MSFDTIARPYAKAIFEIAIKNNSIKKWKQTLILIDQIISFKKIQKFLSGSLSPNCLSSFFIFVIGEYLDEYSKNLIKLLAHNQRFKIFNNILQQFIKLEASYQKIIIVELRSAFVLKKDQVVKIRLLLEEILSSKIKFIYKINHYILDGIIIGINDHIFDFSMQNYLKQLSLALNF
ncbi:ATP synthase F1 subunit delta [Buchnera aphidicola (Aphis craccivora)]|uniref:ATP synthase subunit delta n=1 Tax=Buchnera aphidicola (Aphis craccivora) TaxID=466616 RepID=A0A4D6XNX8_9GAMM|nr:ATP synthase F1 subunit delta [Buchnera aphidicola]QCI16280.1 ATP synthase F1 subunit delta [Buchnera aphidicola (Aphis craccivora)]QLL40425.1 ATP synthase F1 subunit delta [Buchnera aphidicola (Aphis craccivore)]WAI17796.1 MAG: ATP synthase F1 subunit delta [Buchnera aphidicola (Aphis craccivora)]